MKSIKIHDKAYVQGLGHCVNRNRKEVGVRELNRVFDSVGATAEFLGVSGSAVSFALKKEKGKEKTVAGYHVYFVKEVTEHFDEVLEFNRNESEKKDKQLAEMEMENAELRKEAALWRAHLAKEEAARKAKEMEHARLCKAVDDTKANQKYLADLICKLQNELTNAVKSHTEAVLAENRAIEELKKFEEGQGK